MCSARDIALHSAQSLDFKNYTQGLSKLKLGLGNSTKHMDSSLSDGSNPFIVIKAIKHYSFCETMSQVLSFRTALTEFGY